METPIQFLPVDNFNVLKVIRVDGPEWNRFTGFIAYKRKFRKDYQSRTNDFIDDLIFESIKHIYPSAFVYVNKDILFKGEYEDILKSYQGGTSIDFTIRFTPSIPYEKVYDLVGQTFNEYFPKFKFYLFLSPGSDKIQHIIDFIIAYIPFDKIKEFDREIRSFIFEY